MQSGDLVKYCTGCKSGLWYCCWCNCGGRRGGAWSFLFGLPLHTLLFSMPFGMAIETSLLTHVCFPLLGEKPSKYACFRLLIRRLLGFAISFPILTIVCLGLVCLVLAASERIGRTSCRLLWLSAVELKLLILCQCQSLLIRLGVEVANGILDGTIQPANERMKLLLIESPDMLC